jgi:hypothetical protein
VNDKDRKTQTHSTKHRAVVKNQRTTEKWAQAEKRSVIFVGYS